MAVPDVKQKAEIYETLSALNMAFAGIVQHLQTLQQTGLFKSKTAKHFPSFTQELQAEFNQEFLEDLHQLELDEWGRHGKARQRWEKEIRDPDDVFIHAEERRKDSPSSARKQPSRKPCKTGNHSPYHQGHVRVPFFCVPVTCEGDVSEIAANEEPSRVERATARKRIWAAVSLSTMVIDTSAPSASRGPLPKLFSARHRSRSQCPTWTDRRPTRSVRDSDMSLDEELRTAERAVFPYFQRVDSRVPKSPRFAPV